MKRNIYLEGELGEVFTPKMKANVSSIKEALSCIECNFPRFKEYLINADERGLGFTFHVAEKPVKDEKELLLLQNEGDITISVLPVGAKSGGAKILAAIAIVGLMFIPGGAALVGSAAGNLSIMGAAFGGGAATAATVALATNIALVGLSIAVNLAMAGMAQIMAPDPSVDNGGQADESYLFQGAEQAIFEGDPVPVMYGKLRVPGRPVSFQVRNKDQFFADLPMPSSWENITPSNPGDSEPVENINAPIAPTWNNERAPLVNINFGG